MAKCIKLGQGNSNNNIIYTTITLSSNWTLDENNTINNFPVYYQDVICEYFTKDSQVNICPDDTLLSTMVENNISSLYFKNIVDAPDGAILRAISIGGYFASTFNVKVNIEPVINKLPMEVAP